MSCWGSVHGSGWERDSDVGARCGRAGGREEGLILFRAAKDGSSSISKHCSVLAVIGDFALYCSWNARD